MFGSRTTDLNQVPNWKTFNQSMAMPIDAAIHCSNERIFVFGLAPKEKLLDLAIYGRSISMEMNSKSKTNALSPSQQRPFLQT